MLQPVVVVRLASHFVGPEQWSPGTWGSLEVMGAPDDVCDPVAWYGTWYCRTWRESRHTTSYDICIRTALYLAQSRTAYIRHNWRL